ncbi:hypothetical protein IQ279_20060 [Streptomyces verrucosisporus]|uniref:hypothetical protein n=1 Tax=Streptomyces verrucosisporus TaxID=1695161 RepID=UPI0019D13690|nr:hypothetical protein [Streptomyces verrucosisporus]MBN3931894.1 hypothetical protein [Streptomyces verrucosisporus]
MAAWKEPVDRIVAECLARLEKSDRPDVMDYAGRIPADVTGEILGFPLKRFGEMLDAIERAFHADPGNPDQEAEVAAAFEELVDYGRELIVDKRRGPGDDLTSHLVRAETGRTGCRRTSWSRW